MCCTSYRRTAADHRATLEAKRAELQARLRDRVPIEVERHADPLDDTWQLAAREVAAGTFTHDTALLCQVEAALARISDGSFGVCSSCLEAISPARLRAVPWAALCRPCAELVEDERAAAEVACGGLSE
jgi:RNA polymerase-binding transcription factor DksA